MALNPALRKMVSTAKAKYAGNSGSSAKPKDGRNVYRLLAPTNDQADWVPEGGQFWADLGVHWIKPGKNDKPVAVVGDCDTVYQQPSVINTAIEMAINSAHDEDSKKLYEEWKARKSVLVNVINRDGDETEVLELTPTTWGKVLDLIMLYADAGQDITDPNEGADIVITRTGKGLNTNYDVAIAPVIPSAPFKAVPLETVKRATDLNAFIASNFFRGEEQKALNFIAQIAGVAVPRLGGPTGASGVKTPTAALTSSSASVDGAQVDAEAEAAKVEAARVAAAKRAAAAAAAASTTTAETAAVDPVAAKRAEILARQKEAEAELLAMEAAAEAAKAPVVDAASAAPTSGISSLPTSEQDAILAELDGLM
ncbi:hypothetical protein [Agrobacterium sp. CG674]